MPDLDLTPRREPQQAPSRATRLRRLQEADALLVGLGVDGFNPNILSVRADVRGIYRHYSNIWAIMVELADRS